jgi:hypothetical protein
MAARAKAKGPKAMFPRVLRREILILLAAKAAGLTLIFYLFFAPQSRHALPPIESRLLVQPISETDHGHR